MKILDGKKLSEKILDNLAEKIKKERLKLKLAVVLVGKSPVSEIFIREKKRACQRIGIGFQLFKFSAEITPEELKKEIKKIVRRNDIKGAIIQLPLPKKFQSQEFLNIIPSTKDIDVLSEKNIGRFYKGSLHILPPTVAGVKAILEKYKIKIKGKNVVIVGGGELVGKPLAVWFIQKKATVTVVNEFTKDISFFAGKADILISGAGAPNLIKGSMIKKGVVIIDAGVSYKKGKLSGDVDFKSVNRKAGYIAPVPGGVGPMTVACLLENLVILNLKKF